jgi:hypothetical protein
VLCFAHKSSCISSYLGADARERERERETPRGVRLTTVLPPISSFAARYLNLNLNLLLELELELVQLCAPAGLP